MTSLLDQLSHRLPGGIREALLGNSRQDLLSRVTDTLVVFGDELLHAESGRSHRIAPAARSSTEGNIDAAAVAEAAKHLLAAADSERSVLLLLAPSEFLATEQHMPGLSGTNLISAITLQQETILPACDEALALAVSDGGADGNRLALWIRQVRLTPCLTHLPVRVWRLRPGAQNAGADAVSADRPAAG